MGQAEKSQDIGLGDKRCDGGGRVVNDRQGTYGSLDKTVHVIYLLWLQYLQGWKHQAVNIVQTGIDVVL